MALDFAIRQPVPVYIFLLDVAQHGKVLVKAHCLRGEAASRAAGGVKPEIQRRDGASPRSRFGAASGPAPGVSGSSGGSGNPSRDSPELSGRKRRVPEPALASMRHQEERRRQQRLAKTRATAAASR